MSVDLTNAHNYICPDCGKETQEDIPIEVYWCDECKIPIIRELESKHKGNCPLCNTELKYLSKDLRPVFPEERLLLEVIKGKPLEYLNKSVWNSINRYFINSNSTIELLSTKEMETLNIDKIKKDIDELQDENYYENFNKTITKFIEANKFRYYQLKQEATDFIKDVKDRYNFKDKQILVSFSGGKDSTVVSDLVTKGLSNSRITHIFGDTTLEFPTTYEYVERFKKDSKALVRTAINRQNDFYDMCDKIGPPSRLMRWCCHAFKTGPISRTINTKFNRYDRILTFYGIRKNESISRSKYDRIYDSPKITKQKVAAPIFNWKDIDLWLYMFAENLDFNSAYKLGFDRAGCWCCPNNSDRSEFLSKIYMPEKSKKWRDFLIEFAKDIGKKDAEVYVDTGKWKARQGGDGLDVSETVKLNTKACTTEENAKIYKLERSIDDEFYNLFVPFGKIDKELGKSLIGEVLIRDMKTKVPIISLQPYNTGENKESVKIKTLNVENNDDLHRMISYQIRKFNACQKCLACESVCKYGAISIKGDIYKIDEEKCKRCKMCVTAKYLDGGCLMSKYLRTRTSKEEENEI
ncbi:MAG: phosphoadenosine phosphosulfate reductase [Firmicutes bacterium]|nr:phosphoadenosine phosphosulfate reductase [Bacillota bacterium]